MKVERIDNIKKASLNELFNSGLRLFEYREELYIICELFKSDEYKVCKLSDITYSICTMPATRKVHPVILSNDTHIKYSRINLPR